MKQRQFRKWLEANGVVIENGTNHLRLQYRDKKTVMPRHPGKEINEKLRLAILKQLGLK